MARVLRGVKSRLFSLSVETGIEVLDVSFASLLVLTVILFFLNVMLLPKIVIFTRNPALNVFSVYYALQRLSPNDELLALLSALVAAPTPLTLFAALLIRRFKDGANLRDAWSKAINYLKTRPNGRRRIILALMTLAAILITAPFASVVALQPVIVDYAVSNIHPQWYQLNMVSLASSLIVAFAASKLSQPRGATPTEGI